MSKLAIRNTYIYLGDYNTIEEAALVRDAYIIEHNLKEYPLSKFTIDNRETMQN